MSLFIFGKETPYNRIKKGCLALIIMCNMNKFALQLTETGVTLSRKKLYHLLKHSRAGIQHIILAEDDLI